MWNSTRMYKKPNIILILTHHVDATGRVRGNTKTLMWSKPRVGMHCSRFVRASEEIKLLETRASCRHGRAHNSNVKMNNAGLSLIGHPRGGISMVILRANDAGNGVILCSGSHTQRRFVKDVVIGIETDF